MTRRLPFVLALPLLVCTGSAGAQEIDFIARDLRSAGLEPTRDSIVAYLEAVRPTPERREALARNLANLRSPDYDTRRAATEALIRTPRLPQNLVDELLEDPDPEVRHRGQFIRERADLSTQRSRIVAVLSWTIRERPDDVCPLLLDLVDQWGGDPYLQELFTRAVAATARPEDVEVLRTNVASDLPRARIAALLALGELGEGDVVRDGLADPDSAVRLVAATSLLNAGERDGLPVLVDLLDSDDLDVRIHAARRLRYTTGKRFGFAAYDEPSARSTAVALWRGWVRTNTSTQELLLPIPHRQHVQLGRTLIGLHLERKLREVDRNGNTLWEAGGFAYPWGCHALPNGHRLAVDYETKYVVEFDSFGRKNWIVQDLPGKPTNVERLDNGHTLVTLAEPGILLELTPEKEVVWEHRIEGRPTTAQRLENGRTLVCLQFGRRIVEIDRDGNVLWKVDGLRRPHTAQRLDNGNTLVCEMNPGGRVVEFDPHGGIVWQKNDIDNPAQAQRLPNGHTLVSGDAGLQELDPTGKIIRTIKISRSRFHAF